MTDEHHTKSLRSNGEPWWVVVFEVKDEYYASATVDAPNESEAKSEAARIIASQEETDEFRDARASGPFPPTPGESAAAVRPDICHGCGMGCWNVERPPLPTETWFRREREVSTDDDVAWECIICGTLTRLTSEMMEGGL